MEELGIDNPGPDEDEDGTDHPEEHDYHIIMNEYINGRSYNLTTENTERLKILDSRLKNRQDTNLIMNSQTNEILKSLQFIEK